ncbi:cyclase family protein [Streptomyces sp. NPDC020681]|uniref:cyclase family protein n=1 Tax=Streptomyces sp. NPDC020681 TaxID=3365083 RepID=UPI003796E2AD
MSRRRGPFAPSTDRTQCSPSAALAPFVRGAADELPSYAQLRRRTDAPAESAWGLFGERDEVGTLNLAGPEQARAAAACVHTGQTLCLDYPLTAFDPPIAPTRGALRHTIFSRHRAHRDDVLDGFYPQAASQLDGLRHRRHQEHGFYNGTPDAEITEGSPALGIQRWAERGIVTRGLVLDVSRFRRESGRPIDHEGGEHLDATALEDALAAQAVRPRPGDALLLHTGWTQWYLGLDPAAQRRVRDNRRFTGVDQDHDVLAWLWDHRFAVIASDTYAFEALPARDDSPFGGTTDHGMMHQQLIAMLGFAVGELWRLGPLARASADDGRWTCLLVAQPLNLPGGVGSPANATAVR